MANTTLQERVLIGELNQAGLSDSQIAKALGLSLSTVRKWRRRLQRQGTAGLVSQRGRPASGAMSSFSQTVIEAVGNWRRVHPGWGPKTLRSQLGCAPDLAAKRLPSQVVIARWLRQKGLSRSYQKHRLLPQEAASSADFCHEEWEMDARGQEKIPDVGVVALINVNDVFSKVKVMSYPCWLGQERAERHPTTADYQLVLRLAFSEWGLPDRLAVDHDSVFHDNGSASPYPTRLHLWLLALGVSLTFCRYHRPTDQATTERSHQTWQHQVLDGQRFPSQESLWQALNQRRSFLNHQLPCASLGEQPPLVAYPQAQTPRRLYRPEWEAEAMDFAPVYAYLSQMTWFRKASNVGVVALGDYRYSLGKDYIKKEVQITFDPTDQHFVFTLPAQQPKCLPALGLTPADLMGELQPFYRCQPFQLALPFTWHQWRQLHLCHLIRDTI
jgi:transposase